jgi:hypothetical protein
MPDSPAPDPVPDAVLPDGLVPDGATDPAPEAVVLPDETLADVGFEEVTPAWTGSVVYINSWIGDGTGAVKDTIEMIRPDGSARAVRMRANRVWAFGVAHDGKTLAFASADPFQAQRFPDLAGLSDAIQHTWLWKPAGDPVLISRGRTNDECHVFLPGDGTLLTCRRDGFAGSGQDFTTPLYRVASTDLATDVATWLTPESADTMALQAWPRADGSILFEQVVGQSPSLAQIAADATISTVLAGGSEPVVSYDGTRVLFQKAGGPRLWAGPSDDLAAAVETVDPGTEILEDASPSPDGTQVAYGLYESTRNCTNLWIASADGTNPRLLIDCAKDGTQLTVVRWVQAD